MNLSILLKGMLIGFSIAAPVGPIGILCIRRTLTQGRVAGLASGLGAATADAFYGSLAAFGLTFISTFLVNQQLWFRLVGGGFLCFLGFRTFFSPPADDQVQPNHMNTLGAYSSTFVLTLTNPLTILSFTAIFAGFGLAMAEANYTQAGIAVLGVFIGSSTWWVILSSLASKFRGRTDPRALRWINRFSGLVILAFGVATLITILI